MAVIPPDTVLTTKIAVFSPDFNNNTYHTLSIDQKVQGLDQLKASIGAWRWQTKTMYNPKIQILIIMESLILTHIELDIQLIESMSLSLLCFA